VNEAQQAVALGVVVVEVPQVGALEGGVVVAGLADEHRYPWNQLASPPPLDSEHLPDATLVCALEVVEEVAIVLAATNKPQQNFRRLESTNPNNVQNVSKRSM